MGPLVNFIRNRPLVQFYIYFFFFHFVSENLVAAIGRAPDLIPGVAPRRNQDHIILVIAVVDTGEIEIGGKYRVSQKDRFGPSTLVFFYFFYFQQVFFEIFFYLSHGR